MHYGCSSSIIINIMLNDKNYPTSIILKNKDFRVTVKI